MKLPTYDDDDYDSGDYGDDHDNYIAEVCWKLIIEHIHMYASKTDTFSNYRKFEITASKIYTNCGTTSIKLI